MTENKQYSFERMMHSQIFYLTKNFNKEVFGYRSKLNEYLKWIENCGRDEFESLQEVFTVQFASAK